MPSRKKIEKCKDGHGYKEANAENTYRVGFNFHCCASKIDGGWSEWANGECSVTCGNGQRKRTRSCNNPEPYGNGIKCQGAKEETAKCRESCTSNCDAVRTDRQKTCKNDYEINKMNEKNKLPYFASSDNYNNTCCKIKTTSCKTLLDTRQHDCDNFGIYDQSKDDVPVPKHDTSGVFRRLCCIKQFTCLNYDKKEDCPVSCNWNLETGLNGECQEWDQEGNL